uniref:Uncharacterized protein n=1 Tax=Arundo donax TaxID=35708 RepID=A0A0A9TZ84_ARUDO
MCNSDHVYILGVINYAYNDLPRNYSLHSKIFLQRINKRYFSKLICTSTKTSQSTWRTELLHSGFNTIVPNLQFRETKRHLYIITRISKG